MKIRADENYEREMIDDLSDAGYGVVTILDMSPSIDDETVFKPARKEGRALLTNDQDFGVIAEHSEAHPPAVVLMRLERLSFRRRMEIVLNTFAELDDNIPGQFIVIDPHQLRCRSYEP
jgi:predicted nuclease of predicted toxin-antitoxin system